MAIDFDLIPENRTSRKPQENERYEFTADDLAEELDNLIDKYGMEDRHDMAVIMSAVKSLAPRYYYDIEPPEPQLHEVTAAPAPRAPAVNSGNDLTDDGDYDFLTRLIIPCYRKSPHYMENVRALFTALCVHHGVDKTMPAKGYAEALRGVMDALGRSDEETKRYLEEYLDLFDFYDDDDYDG